MSRTAVPTIRGARLLHRLDGFSPEQNFWDTSFTNGAGSSSSFNAGGFIDSIAGAAVGRYGGMWSNSANRWPTNIGLLARFEPATVSSTRSYWTLRATSSTISANSIPNDCYVVRATTNTALELMVCSGGTLTGLASTGFTWATGQTYWIRFEVVGSNLFVRAWNSLTESEGDGAALSTSDPTIATAGGTTISCYSLTTSARNMRLHQYILYEPQTVTGSLATNILTPAVFTPHIGGTVTLAATVPTASSTVATVKETKRYIAKIGSSSSSKANLPIQAKRLLVKPNTSDSATATPLTETKILVTKVGSSTATSISTILISGTVNFAAVVSETKNLRLRRVTPPISALTRTYQSSVSTSARVICTLRRLVRRTGKFSTSDNSKAILTYGRRFVAKSAVSSKAKATMDTTSSAQGNAPAIPATILNATPASNRHGWGGSSPILVTTPTYDFWKSQFGFNGFTLNYGGAFILSTLEDMVRSFYFEGDASNVVDPLNKPASYQTKYAYHHMFMGYGAPPVSGGSYGTSTAFTQSLGPTMYRRLHPDFLFFLGFYLRDNLLFHSTWPVLGDWYDDAKWVGFTRTMSNLGAGLKQIGASGISFDTEFAETFDPWTCTSTTRPPISSPHNGLRTGCIIRETDTGNIYRWTGTAWEPRTINELMVKVEARGFQFGQGLYNAYPDCQIMTYEWRPNMGTYDSKNQGASYGVAWANKLQDRFYWGMMRAMQVANGTKSRFWRWDDSYYKAGYNGPIANTQRGMQGQSSWLSRNLAPAVRDFMMMRFHVMCANWIGHQSGVVDTPEPDNANYLQTLWRWSQNGWLSDYFGANVGGSIDSDKHNLGPAGSFGNPLQNIYTDSRTNPPGGHQTGMLATTSTTTQDSTPISVGTVNQSRSGSTVTLTFTAAHSVFGIRNVHWKQYASNGTSILAQGEAIMVFNENGGTTATNFNNAFMSCTITVTNATSGLYVILDIYSTVSQRVSRRVQFI